MTGGGWVEGTSARVTRVTSDLFAWAAEVIASDVTTLQADDVWAAKVRLRVSREHCEIQIHGHG